MSDELDRDELLRRLRELTAGDPEINHGLADQLLLTYIDDDEITRAFMAISKWYA